MPLTSDAAFSSRSMTTGNVFSGLARGVYALCRDHKILVCVIGAVALIGGGLYAIKKVNAILRAQAFEQKEELEKYYKLFSQGKETHESLGKEFQEKKSIIAQQILSQENNSVQQLILKCNESQRRYGAALKGSWEKINDLKLLLEDIKALNEKGFDVLKEIQCAEQRQPCSSPSTEKQPLSIEASVLSPAPTSSSDEAAVLPASSASSSTSTCDHV